MKLLLVDNLLFEGTREHPRFDLQPHLGLMSLVAVLRSAGHESSIYDPKSDLAGGKLRLDGTLYDNMVSRILSFEPDVIGFTALGCNFHCVVRAASRLKEERPDLPILLGGPHATILAREILKSFPAFDVIVRNEAEQSILPVLEHLSNFKLADIQGISFRSREGEVTDNPGNTVIADLDTLPMAAYDCYPLADMKLDSIRVEAGRGCPFSCTFCSTASFFGRSYRLKSTARLVREMETLNAEYGYTDFKLNHDLFTVNRKKVVHFCEAVAGYGYTWACSARVDCVDPELLRIMRAAGCRRIYFGIEAGSFRMQEISRKGLDVRLVKPTLELTEQLGIRTITSYITGYPEEREADQEETLDQVGWHHCRREGLNDSQLHLLTPEPGTKLIADYGCRLLLDAHVSGFNFPRIQPEDDKLLEQAPAIFANHYHFPTELPRRRLIFMTTAWIALHEVGRTTLQYLLRAFDGRLSRFLNDAYLWHSKTEPEEAAASLETIAGFMAARFGQESHLVSLLRYAAALHEVQKAGSVREVMSDTDIASSGDAILGLSLSVVIVKAMHDCPALLKRLAANPGEGLIEERLAGPIADYLLVRYPQSRFNPAGVGMYEVNCETTGLLETFAEPTSYWRCCLKLSEREGLSLPAWEDIERLLRMGILEVRGRSEVEYSAASA